VTPEAGHSPEALAALAAGGLAALLSGAAGPFGFALLTAALLLGWGRGRGWPAARSLARPRVASALAAIYLPVFLLDFASGARLDPVLPLVRLVIFLASVEVVAGDPARAHRPILLGLLLVVASAAETTEIVFALPLGLFAWAAARALMRHGLVKDAPEGDLPGRIQVRGALPMAAAALLLGLLLFGLIPRVGAGWGGRQWAGRETGLSDAVDLGDVARIKRSHAVAFLARLDPEPTDPESVYWRGRVLVKWTGSGWIPGGTEPLRPIALPAETEVSLPSDAAVGPDEVVEANIEVFHRPHTTLVVPGVRPLSLRVPRSGRVYLDADGALVGRPGEAPRQYTVTAKLPRRADAEPSAAQSPPLPEPAAYLDYGRQPAEVVAWVRSLAPGETHPWRIVQAYLADLQRRPYSLDPVGVDPSRPLVSFLEGAPVHCEYFASALVIALRMRGIPARAVAGYLGGDLTPGGSDYVVRESRAHLWAEVALPGVGWVTVDPTPPEGRRPVAVGAPGIRLLWERAVLAWDTWIIGFDFRDQITLFLLLKERIETTSRALGASLISLRTWVRIAAVTVAGLLVMAVVWVLRLRRRGPAAGQLPGYYRRLLGIAERAGLSPREAETASEFAARVGARLGDPLGVAWISHLYERERFGERRASPGELARAQTMLAALWRHVPADRDSPAASDPGRVPGS
jgi:protein-glutamine gamma-glutamyltransferase